MNEPGDEPGLVVAARRFHDGQSGADVVLGAFRAAEVYFERLPGLVLPTVDYEGMAWVPIFSTLSRLAAFVTARGGDSGGEVAYVCMPGSRLLDCYVVQLCKPAGIVLDALDEHRMLAPPAQPATAN